MRILQTHKNCELAMLLLMVVQLTQQAPPGTVRDPCSKPDDTLTLRGHEDGEGMVLVCRDGQWKRVCDDDWTREDAIVACRQLKFPHPEAAEQLASRWGQLFQTRANSSVPQCDGSEQRLSDCPTRQRNDDLCPELCARVKCLGVLPTSQSSSTVATSNQTPPPPEIHESSGQSTPSSSLHTLPTVTPPPPPPPPQSPNTPTPPSNNDNDDPSTNSTPQDDKSDPKQEEDTTSSESDPSHLVAMVIGGVVAVVALAALIASATLIVCGIKRGQYHLPKTRPSNQRCVNNLQPCGAYYVVQKITTVNNPAYVDLPPDPIYETVH